MEQYRQFQPQYPEQYQPQYPEQYPEQYIEQFNILQYGTYPIYVSPYNLYKPDNSVKQPKQSFAIEI